MSATSHFSPATLVLDEMADLALYETYRSYVRQPELIKLFDRLIVEEKKHVAFWKKKVEQPPVRLDVRRSLKIRCLALFGRVFGVSGMLLVLEAVEVHGIRKYLDLWSSAPEGSLRTDVLTILKDELQHEDHMITLVAGRSVRPEAIRNAFLGFNDGSVEILGAVSGFSAAFVDVGHVLIAGLTVAVAGAMSMAVGAFMATSAEREVAALDQLRRRALSVEAEEKESQSLSSPLKAAAIVGITYLVGALVPIAPFLFGATNALPSILVSGCLILIVSASLAFLSGMRIRRRLLINGGLIAFAVIVSTLFGAFLERWN
ncbi:VIT1/CCC1 transporter family protein [Patescibacteria group bacterium]|nr:VIT1/CCC1 transporter family protein [Patescibacteria group bacterium]